MATEQELLNTIAALSAFTTTAEHRDEQKRCLKWCEEFFIGIDVHVTWYEKNTVPSLVMANCEGTDFDCIIIVHADMAEGQQRSLRTEDGRVYGRALADMKAFVATSLHVMREVVLRSLDVRVALCITCDEEDGGENGARYLLEDCGYRARVVLVPDDGGVITQVVAASKHILTYVLAATGRTVHACRPWDGDSAFDRLIYATARVHAALTSRLGDMTAKPVDVWVPSFAFTQCSGGGAINEIPNSASATLDVRLVEEIPREEIDEILHEACGDRVAVSCVFEGYPTYTDLRNPLVQKYIHTVEKMTGEAVTYKRSGGGTDGRYAAHLGMPVIVHQGTCGDAQGEHEWVEIASLVKLVEIQTTYILDEMKAAV